MRVVAALVLLLWAVWTPSTFAQDYLVQDIINKPVPANGTKALLQYRTRICRAVGADTKHPFCWHDDEQWRLLDPDMNINKKIVETYAHDTIPTMKTDENSIVVYIHAFVPHDKVAGLLVLDKLLSSMRYSGLLQAATMVIVLGYGDASRIEEVTKDQYPKVTVLTGIANTSYYFEYPTLAVLQTHARAFHPETKILYLHSKGITYMMDHSRSYIRDALSHYSITLYNESVTRLHNGWDTDGMLHFWIPWHHYFANFWWAKAKIAANNVYVPDIVWHWRYGAERWVLSSGKTCRTYASVFGSHVLWNNYKENLPAKSLESYMIDPVHDRKPNCDEKRKPGQQ